MNLNCKSITQGHSGAAADATQMRQHHAVAA